MLKTNEGVRRKVYKDSLGIKTIGVGENMERAGARERFVSRGLDFDGLLAGKVQLTDAQIDSLLDEEINTCVRDLEDRFAAFHDFPEAAQLVLIDLRFNLGAAGLSTFVNTLRAFKEFRFKDAAANLLKSKYASQVGPRAQRNAKLLNDI